MQNWVELYKELSCKISDNINEIEWIDLWHNQVNFLSDDHPFPTPAVFLGFRAKNLMDKGLKVQSAEIQVDIYLYYETFLDTFKGAYNQKDALAFLQTADDLFGLLHASNGASYSGMRRIDFHPVDTGGAGNLYRIVFEALMTDYAATPKWEDLEVDGIIVERGDTQRQAPDFKNGYIIP